MEMTLQQLKPRESAIVTSIGGKGATRRRLIDMGITPGADVKMIRTAPLGDPLEITVRGYELSLRKEEASRVVIIPVNR